MPATTLTFKVDTDLKNAFSAAAAQSDRTVGQLLRGFIRDYLQQRNEEREYDLWFRQQVEEGLADIEAGRVHSHEEVKNEMLQFSRQLAAKYGS